MWLSHSRATKFCLKWAIHLILMKEYPALSSGPLVLVKVLPLDLTHLDKCLFTFHTVNINLLGITISYLIIFSFIFSMVWNLISVVILVLGQAKSCRKPNFDGERAVTPGQCEVLPEFLHEKWWMSSKDIWNSLWNPLIF